MQQVQDKLEFDIDTPSDAELAKVFAARQKNQAATVLRPSSTSRNAKKRQHA